MTRVVRESPRFAVTMAMLVLAAFALSAWSLIQRDQDVCDGRNVALDVLTDVLQLTEPPPDQMTAKAAAFYATAYARIDKARC